MVCKVNLPHIPLHLEQPGGYISFQRVTLALCSPVIALKAPSSGEATSSCFIHRWPLSFNYVLGGVFTSPHLLNCLESR